jgi:hypothetical protein
MIVIDENGDIAAGTSTNGATHKIPGKLSENFFILLKFSIKIINQTLRKSWRFSYYWKWCLC